MEASSASPPPGSPEQLRVDNVEPGDAIAFPVTNMLNLSRLSEVPSETDYLDNTIVMQLDTSHSPQLVDSPTPQLEFRPAPRTEHVQLDPAHLPTPQDNRNAIADSSTLRLILIYDLKKQKPAEIN